MARFRLCILDDHHVTQQISSARTGCSTYVLDGETDPSVEVPVGDFFGTGFGMDHSWHSMPLTVIR